LPNLTVPTVTTEFGFALITALLGRDLWSPHSHVTAENAVG